MRDFTGERLAVDPNDPFTLRGADGAGILHTEPDFDGHGWYGCTREEAKALVPLLAARWNAVPDLRTSIREAWAALVRADLLLPTPEDLAEGAARAETILRGVLDEHHASDVAAPGMYT